MSHVSRAARAMRNAAKRTVDEDQRAPRYATVRSIDPLTAEITSLRMTLGDDEDLVLGQWARRYDNEYGIAEGDTLIVQPMDDGDWIAVEVLSDTEPTAP